MTRMQVASGKWRSGSAALFLVALALSLLAAPPAVEAQQAGRLFRVAYVTYPSPPPPTSFAGLEAFRQGLRDLGWIEGKTVAIEMRTGESEKTLPDVFAQLVRERFDLIVTTNTPAALAAQRATTTIPIVAAVACDPVEAKAVGSLAHPGGNLTGLTLITSEVAGKRIEFLKEIVPGLSRVAALYNPEMRTFPVTVAWVTQSEIAARALGITLQRAEVIGVDRYDAAFATLKKDGVGALTVIEGPRYILQSPQIAAAAVKHGLATVFPYREQVDAGGLMAYGANMIGMWRRAAHLADRILRGAKPGDLPLEQPTKFELVINGKTAQALGLAIPPSLLMRGAEVIE